MVELDVDGALFDSAAVWSAFWSVDAETHGRAIERADAEEAKMEIMEVEDATPEVRKAELWISVALLQLEVPRKTEIHVRNRTGVEPISPVNKLHMCLRWLGGGSYHDIRVTSGVSVSAFYAK
ncbi:uncharacterized protein PITG_16363 [Phytophthora infestans T30-4]|uniref:Uncharacterized protein n=1 Tax=Phytophthora infestans (strain T30-4) TaxID=403677 RepID=D0NU43_PHYIT|nr:uncharacterized protein PITG_16363 [Phytophthora infestans T30-4]EEY65167.1 hypothetical protein PITG_16363 [Phytophthora infestans T30-4]|eukprot:XP_002897424.1 hypothetical protein PITG_16363 [Phytophthora infestans T30-4]